jgi:hypothetical protein
MGVIESQSSSLPSMNARFCDCRPRDSTRFQRRGGRKRIVAPDGSELTPRSKPQPDGTLPKALARAWRWQRMLDDGVYTSVTEIAEAEGIGRQVSGSAVK